MPNRPDVEDEWARTRAETVLQTQLMGDKEAYLGGQNHAIGRRINAEQHELFVVCDPSEAMHQQFELRTPDFLALHDLKGADSLRLLRGLARALRRKVQKLVIRRQGFGVALATIEFVELPGPADGPRVRLYSTFTDTPEPAERNALAHVLLGQSRLAVVLTGGADGATAEPTLLRLRDAMAEPAWRNHQLLWLPVGLESLSSPAHHLPMRGAVQVHTAPPVSDLGQAWPIISSLWNQLRAGESPYLAPTAPAPAEAPLPRPGTAATTRPAPAPAPISAPPVAPLPLRPMPATRAPVAAVAGSPDQPGAWREYIEACASIPGMLSCCVFDLATERTLAHAGSRPGAAALASSGSGVFRSLVHVARSMGLPPGEPDLAVTLAEHHLILHPLPQTAGLALHAVLDAHVANLTLVRMKLHRLDPGQSDAPTAA